MMAWAAAAPWPGRSSSTARPAASRWSCSHDHPLHSAQLPPGAGHLRPHADPHRGPGEGGRRLVGARRRHLHPALVGGREPEMPGRPGGVPVGRKLLATALIVAWSAIVTSLFFLYG